MSSGRYGLRVLSWFQALTLTVWAVCPVTVGAVSPVGGKAAAARGPSDGYTRTASYGSARTVRPSARLPERSYGNRAGSLTSDIDKLGLHVDGLVGTPRGTSGPGAPGSAASRIGGGSPGRVPGDIGAVSVEIDKLSGQIGKLTGQIDQAANAGKPLVRTGTGIVDKIRSFPRRVADFRQRYGIPLENPTIDQEWMGIQRYMLEKSGMTPTQARIMAARMASTPLVEHLKQPFRPASIAMVVGINAGMNLLRNMRDKGNFDLPSAFAFVRDSSFWGGMIGSGVAYGLASYVASAFLPPGLGVLGALVPTFAGLFASSIGWEFGAGDKSLGEVLENMSWAEAVGQAAGSTLGMVLGGQLAMSILTGMSLAGPLGAVAGAMVLGPLGARIAGFVRDFFMGDKEGLEKAGAEMKAFLQKTGGFIGELEQGGYIPAPEASADSMQSLDADAKASSLRARYDELYEQFIQAHRANDGVRAIAVLEQLRAVKARLDRRIAEQSR